MKNDSMQVRVWHVSGTRFRRFNPRRSTMGGIMWFTDSLEEIVGGKLQGTQGQRYVYEVILDVSRPAGWKEYGKFTLGEVKGMGFDSIRLENSGSAGKTYWIVFNPAEHAHIVAVHKLEDLRRGAPST